MLTRRVLLVVLAVVLATGRISVAQPSPLRVLTYNIHHGAGMDQRLDLARIAEVIKQARPDLVALQEVDVQTGRSNGVDQAAELSRLTGMHGAFGKAMDYDGGQYGVAVLSRFPLIEVENFPLPNKPPRAPPTAEQREQLHEPRAALAVRVRPTGAPTDIWFASTHLDHLSSEMRICQAEKIGSSLAAKANLPAILAGDLNATPRSATMVLLSKFWTDTAAKEPAPTAPAGEPRSKIDYVLFRPAEQWRTAEVRVLDEAVASDHRPFLAVLEWQ